MRVIRILPLFLCLLLLFACGAAPAGEAEQEKNGAAISADDVILTVGSEPVYAVVYRYHLAERLRTIEEHGLYDREKYLSYVANPNVTYLYVYYDTHTEEGARALADDVLTELALEAAAIDAGQKSGYQLNVQEQTYLNQAEENAQSTLDKMLKANGGAYESREAFYSDTGFTEDRFVEMYVRNMKAGVFYNHLLEDYKASHTLTDEEIRTGYERIVKETFQDRYSDGMYSQYLAYYMAGARSFPSLYVPDDAIFIRLFVKSDPTEAEKTAIREQAEADFNALYASAENEFTAQGTAGDLAVAPNDSLIDGLYEAAKDVPVGSVGTMQTEKDGKTTGYWFLRVEGETGVVPIDRYPGVRERVVSQLLGAACMDTLRETVNDPAVTVRNEELISAIVSGLKN
ncbi:MAG: hypothetical protein II117_00575 [Clostridia bacterium]|nr:hypothetical protein [Clostridia bacterium]